MTQVQIKESEEGYRLEIAGHAGNVEICNSCSTLSYALVHTLMNEDVKHKAHYIGPGLTDIEIMEKSDRVKDYLTVILYGYGALAHQYPDNVQVIQ